MSAFRAKLFNCPRLIGFDVFLSQRVTPTAVGALVDENLGAALEYRSAHWRDRSRIFLHVVEGAMEDYVVPSAFVDGNIKERGDLVHLAFQVVFQILIVNEINIWKVADTPPGVNVAQNGNVG